MNLNNKQFVGSWELLEWATESIDGRKEYPFGTDPIGQITYESNGSMSVMIMKNNRTRFLSEDPFQGQPDEVIDAFNGFIAYSGIYIVTPGSNQVVHQIRISSFPNWTGQDQIRKFEFHEGKLTLSTDLIGPNRHKLVWRKSGHGHIPVTM